MEQQKFRKVLNKLDRISDPNTNIRIFIEDVFIPEIRYCTSMYGGKFTLIETNEGKVINRNTLSVDEGIEILTRSMRVGPTHGLILASNSNFEELEKELDVYYIEETNSIVIVSIATEVLKANDDIEAVRFMEHRRMLRQSLEFSKRSRRLKTNLGNLQTRFSSLVIVPNKVGDMVTYQNDTKKEVWGDYIDYKFEEGSVPKPVVVIPNINRLGSQVSNDTQNFTKVYRRLDLVDYLFPQVTSRMRSTLSLNDEVLISMVLIKDNKELIDKEVILASTSEGQIRSILSKHRNLNVAEYKSNVEKYTGWPVDDNRFIPWDYVQGIMLEHSIILEEEGKDNVKILKEKLRQEW